jgi:hypothetical protein
MVRLRTGYAPLNPLDARAQTHVGICHVIFIDCNKSEELLFQTFHRKADSLAVDIYFEHFHFHMLLKLYNRGRV